MRKPKGKTVLLPGLLLAVAALAVLFTLQIKWMNDSLWTESLRYRREALETVNRIARFTLESLELDRLDPVRPEESLEEWRLDSDYPRLIGDVLVLRDDPGSPVRVEEYFQDRKVIYFFRHENDLVLFLLEGAVLYGELFLSNLTEYAPDYRYEFTYRKESILNVKKERLDWAKMSNESVFSFFLPRAFDGGDRRSLTDMLEFRPDNGFLREGGPPVDKADGPGMLFFPHLTIELYDGRGTESFARRLRIINVSLISTLGLIVVGSYLLLFRLYREEERQHRAGQTFVASVSHELRTPVAVIKSASENLSRGVVSQGERAKAYGGVIRREADRLERMVESILYYSRLEGGEGKISSDREMIDPREFTGEILAGLKLTHPGMSWEKDLEGAPRKVMIDREAYRLILENLVNNAVLHGGGEGIRILLESDYPSRWRLIVEDRGPGISKSEQKRVFEPFVRGRSSMENQKGGSGLGLHLVKTAVRELEGRLTLESPYESVLGQRIRGCRFTVILPAHLNSPPSRGEG